MLRSPSQHKARSEGESEVFEVDDEDFDVDADDEAHDGGLHVAAPVSSTSQKNGLLLTQQKTYEENEDYVDDFDIDDENTLIMYRVLQYSVEK